MRILFVCSQNRFRSPTAEAVFAGLEGLEVASAGLNSGAPTTVTGDLIEWADVIMVMEKTHLNRLSKRFRPLLRDKRVVVLAIPDEFTYMDPDLVALVQRRVRAHLRLQD